MVPYDSMHESGAAAAVLATIRAAAPALPAAAQAKLEEFMPCCVRVAFETMGGRQIRPASSLCGWSADKLRANGGDGGLKLLVLLGDASSVTEGFKYSRRKDEQALEVPLRPGEMLLLYGEARSWLSAVTGYAPPKGRAKESGGPFSFVHLSFEDLRNYAKAKPKEYGKLLRPSHPSAGDGGYKWMQFSYTVRKAPSGPGGLPVIDLRGHE